MFCLVKTYIGEGKPEAPVYWGNVGGTEIMTIGDLKKQFLTHQAQRIGRGWLRNDTAKAILDAKLADAVRKGIDVSCVKPPASTTVSAYHSALMSAPEIGRRVGAYKPEHRDIAETSVPSMMSDLAGLLYLLSMIGNSFPT